MGGPWESLEGGSHSQVHLAGSGVLSHGTENANIDEWYLLPDSFLQMKLNARGWADVHL